MVPTLWVSNNPDAICQKSDRSAGKVTEKVPKNDRFGIFYVLGTHSSRWSFRCHKKVTGMTDPFISTVI